MSRTLAKISASIKGIFKPPTGDALPLVLTDDLGNIDDKFYWREFSNFLTEDFYSALIRDYPPISLFEKHVGIDRGPARPHDRYYLSLGSSKYHRDGSTSSQAASNQLGSVELEGLPAVWQLFIEKLRGPEYRKFIGKILKKRRFDMRFAWHMGFSGAEICPHLDNKLKLGTQIFYFNSVSDWNPDWGGQTVLLSGLQKKSICPEFEDFSHFQEISNVGNNSLFFRNSPTAWHGVRPLECPPGNFRKIFTVIYDSRKSIY
jgi:hypothetical protein